MKTLVTLVIATVLAAAAAAEELTLETALAAALDHHPQLLAADAEARAAGHDARQAGAWANPSVFLRLENAPRDGDLWDDAGRIFGLAQPLPVFGARGAARRVGQAEAAVAQAAAAAARQTLEAEVRRAYADTRHAQQALSMRTQALAFARDVLTLVQRQVEAGDAARVSLLRARRAYHAAESELRSEQSRLTAALTVLSSFMGRPLTGELTLAPPPRLRPAEPAESAQLEVARAAVEAAAAGVALAGRERWPEIELEAGLRRGPEGDGFDAGISLGLPLWDRGEARIQAARARQAAGEYREAAARRGVDAAREAALARRSNALVALEQQTARVIPDAEAALAAVKTAHAAGDADLSEVLLVSREWIDARLVELDWERAAALAEADLVALQ